ADLAGAAGRGIPRVDAGADVDAVRLAGTAGDHHRAVAGHAGCRRAAGDSLPGPRADDGGLPGAAAAPRVRHRVLRRWPSSPRRGARLAGTVRPACEQRLADPPARPFSFACPGSSVVRVAAAWPVASVPRG